MINVDAETVRILRRIRKDQGLDCYAYNHVEFRTQVYQLIKRMAGGQEIKTRDKNLPPLFLRPNS